MMGFVPPRRAGQFARLFVVDDAAAGVPLLAVNCPEEPDR
jgi:hypothetical protein